MKAVVIILGLAVSLFGCAAAVPSAKEPMTELTEESVDVFSMETGFEGYDNEYSFGQADWEKEGFSPRWVEGFEEGRARIDTTHAQSGKASLRVAYPSGGVGPGETGAQVPLDFSAQPEVHVSYWLRFSDNFDWGGSDEGGKLPGLAGGENCSGGAVCDGTNGFSARLMWRTGGKAVLYLYHMDKPGEWGEDVDLVHGDQEIIFEKGKWYQIEERVKVNTGNEKNGEVDVWINGELALQKRGIRFVTDGSGVNNFYFSTFHGGSGETWAPSETCHIWYDNINVVTK